MKSIKKLGFSDQYYLTEQGLIFNSKTNRYYKPYKDHTFKLKNQCDQIKTISLKSLYYKTFRKVFCIDKIQNLENEKWKPIKGSQFYFISNYSRLKSYKGYESKLIKPFKNKKKNYYYSVKLIIDGKAKNYLLHRLVAEAFCQMPKDNIENYQVHHKDFKRQNNTAENLIWLTKEEHKRLHEQHNKKNDQKKVIQ